eukprot:5842220-Amphidinium_carterae.1
MLLPTLSSPNSSLGGCWRHTPFTASLAFSTRSALGASTRMSSKQPREATEDPRGRSTPHQCI